MLFIYAFDFNIFNGRASNLANASKSINTHASGITCTNQKKKHSQLSAVVHTTLCRRNSGQVSDAFAGTEPALAGYHVRESQVHHHLMHLPFCIRRGRAHEATNYAGPDDVSSGNFENPTFFSHDILPSDTCLWWWALPLRVSVCRRYMMPPHVLSLNFARARTSLMRCGAR